MSNERTIGIVLIVIGALALISRLGGGGWFWVGLVAAVLLAVYARQRGYGFLVAGSILAGIAVGLLLGGGGGMILLGLAAGFFAIDRVEPKSSRWPLYPAAILAAIGVLLWIGATGLLGSLWFALILVAVGVYLLWRSDRAETWVYAEPSTPPPASEPSPVVPESPSPPAPSSPVVPEPPSPDRAQASPDTEVVKNAAAARAAVSEEEPEEVLETEFTGEEAEVYRRLEGWRKARAAQDNLPAYIVLTNASMAQIARERPGTLEALGKVKGIGPIKLERYGEEILSVVKEAA